MPSYPFNLAASTQKKDQGIFWSYPLNFCFKKGPERPKMPIRSREHLGTGRCEPQIGAALVTQEPSQLDRAGERGAELIRCAARVEERTVDQFDEDAPILHRLAISTNLRAALSGSVKALGSTNFMGSAANRAAAFATVKPPIFLRRPCLLVAPFLKSASVRSARNTSHAASKSARAWSKLAALPRVHSPG
jgi:hypothetical protein